MTIQQAVALGIAGDELGKQVAGSEVSISRTATSTALGAGLGAAAAGTFTVVAGTAGFVASAPIVVPLAVAAGAVSFVKSLFD